MTRLFKPTYIVFCVLRGRKSLLLLFVFGLFATARISPHFPEKTKVQSGDKNKINDVNIVFKRIVLIIWYSS